MQRASGRASPTPTTFSGISNYKTDSYRPIGGSNGTGNPPSVPALDSRTIARIHYEELSKYLAAYLAKAPANSRANARQKLTRLTKQQFQELSTDVYDELVRRKKNTSDNDVPFLPVRADFHPKRNQARQKLATLPSSRFEDLSSDVYYELVRRYPDFKEEGLTPTDTPVSPNSTYDDVPSPEFPNPNSPPQPQSSLSSGPGVRRHTVRDSEDRGVDSGYGGSPYGRKSVDDRDYAASSGRRSNDVYSSGRRSNDLYSGRMSEDSSSGGGLAYRSSIASRRRPSQDTTRRSGPGGEDSSTSELYRRPSVSDSVSTGTTAHSATAMSSVVIPNKSTMAEEEIEVPYGRDTRDSQSTAMDERERERDRSRSRGDLDSSSDLEPSPLGMGGLSGLRDRLKNAENEDESEKGPAAASGGDRSGDEYFERLSYGRTSVQSDRSAGGGAGPRNGRASTVTTEEQEKMRREYEYKIATMQSRITSLERDLGNAEDQESKWREGEDRVRMMDEELRELRKRAEEESNTVRNLRRELDELREQRAREKENEARRAQADEEELVILRERCERLEEERQNGGSVGGPDPEIVEQLRSDMQGLLTELSELSRRNDELMTAKDHDLVLIRDLDQQMKEYKRKYEQAKTELRNLKATSQLFLQAPKQQIEDQLPFSPDGGVLDIHVTAFVSAIDSLLTAGRSNAPTRVLAPMKSIVNAVHAIIEDVRFYERRNSNADVEHLRSLRERADATLSNLMAAAKSHAQSSGMAPVSLLDAAASHVSVTMTEIGKTVSVRKATKAEQEQFAATSPPLPPAPARTSYSPSLRTVDEMRSSGIAAAAASSTRSASGSVSSVRRIDNNSPVTQARVLESPAALARASPVSRLSLEERRRPPSGPSSSNGSSPPPIFDGLQGDRGVGSASEESAAPEGNEDAWAELKPYLEAQTETIVYDIQAVLAGVRAPAPPSQLNENVTQIITIVSSIVAVCNGNFPPASAAEGMEIVGQLSEHANKLSEVQAQADLTKETRQTMAKSSFAIANAMKALMKL